MQSLKHDQAEYIGSSSAQCYADSDLVSASGGSVRSNPIQADYRHEQSSKSKKAKHGCLKTRTGGKRAELGVHRLHLDWYQRIDSLDALAKFIAGQISG